MKQFKKLAQYPVLVLFFGLLLLFTAADIIAPDREYSELENTKLAQAPAFNLDKLLQNKWTAEYGNYVKEQFIFRDGWIDLQSRAESLLFHKAELGGMLVGEVNEAPQLFTQVFRLSENEEKQLPKNISAVAQFGQNHPNVTFLLAPSASLIYREEVPANAPMFDEDSALDEIFFQVDSSVSVLDMRGAFREAKADYIYYHTDHHWTTDGAYLAYLAFCEQVGLTPWEAENAQPVQVPDFYGTSYSSSRLWNTRPDSLKYYPELDGSMTIYDVIGENSFKERETTGLYEEGKLETRDKYAMFLHGNNGYSRISGKGQGKILVIKDSYANCLVPFLTVNYDTVDVIDLRTYRYSLDKMIEENAYDNILILYNFQSFKADSFLTTIIRPSTL